MFNWDQEVSRTRDLRSTALKEEQDQQNQRNWFERVLSPFEAPQQFLFSLTRSVAEDGFQWGDVGDAFSHGARYFNPFSNQERIQESEIADIFFGKDRSQEGAGSFFAELGISLLYDPLWASAAAKGVGATAGVVRGIERITNPASLGIEAIAHAGRQTKMMVDKVGSAALGKTRWNDLSYRVASTLVPPSRLIDSKWMEPINRAQTAIQEAQMRVAPVIKYVREVGKDGDEMLMRALTDSEIGYARELGASAKASQKRALKSFESELDARGMDKERFFEAFQVYKDISLGIEADLVRTGVISGEAATQMAHRYLRNTVNFKQSPVDFSRRLDQMIQSTVDSPEHRHLYKSRRVFQEVQLREALAEARDELSSAATPRGLAFQQETILPSAVQKRYFPNVQGDPNSRRFNLDNFMDDFTERLDTLESMTPRQAIEYIQEDMMGGIPMPSSFKATLMDYLAKGQVDTQTIPQWQEWLSRGRAAGQVGFRNFAQNVDVVKQRNAIPDELLTDLLDLSPNALPRMMGGITEGGRQAAIANMFDELSGAVRLSADDVNTVKGKFASAYNRGINSLPEASVARSTDPTVFRRELRNTPEYQTGLAEVTAELQRRFPDMDPAELQSIARRIDDGALNASDVIGYQNGLASRPIRDPDTGLITNLEDGMVLVDDSSAWGSLAGTIVPAHVYRHLSQYTKILDNTGGMDAASRWSAVGDWISATTSAFKFLKIAADGGAHMRDTIGSIIQMDIMGMNPFKVESWKKAVNVVKRAQDGDIDDYVRSAHDVGFNLFGSTLAGTELGRAAARVTDTVATGPRLDWIDETRTVFQRAVDGVQGVGGRAADLYQFRESVLRTYTYVNKYDDLVAAATKQGTQLTKELSQDIARQAAEFTNRTLFNYADVSLGMEFARKYGIAPFITFPAKAAGQMVDVLYNNPMRILKYDRTIDSWNDHWAGGDEAHAREIQALPQYQRESMVVRLPWESTDGEAMYLDLSYFLPWAAVRDISEDATELAFPFRGLDVTSDQDGELAVRGSYPGASSGGGVFSPVIAQLISPIATGKDGLGREIFTETSSTAEKASAIARHIHQFLSPPTLPGGSTADSVGRAIAAAARTSPEPVDWVETLGLSMRTHFRSDDILNRYEEGPTGRALPNLTDNPYGQAALGGLSLFAPVSVSNPERSARNEALGVDAFESQVTQRMNQISSNPNLSQAQKDRQIQRYRDLLQARAQSLREYREFLFPQ